MLQANKKSLLNNLYISVIIIYYYYNNTVETKNTDVISSPEMNCFPWERTLQPNDLCLKIKQKTTTLTLQSGKTK